MLDKFLHICNWALTCYAIAYFLPQLRTLIKTKDTKIARAFSPWTYAIWLLCTAVWEVSAIVNGDIRMIVIQAFEFVMLLMLLVLTVKYGEHVVK